MVLKKNGSPPESHTQLLTIAQDRELMRKFIKAVEAYGDIVADGQRLHQNLQYDIERLSQLVPPIQQLNQQLSNQPLEQLIRSLDTNSNIHFRR